MREKTVIHTDKAPSAVGPYSQAVVAGGMVYASGQIPLTPSGGLVQSGIGDQARQALDNLKAVLEAAGSDFSLIVKTTIFLTDLADFAAVNEVYGSYFQSLPPARSCVQVAALPKGAGIEIEAVAMVE